MNDLKQIYDITPSGMSERELSNNGTLTRSEDGSSISDETAIWANNEDKIYRS